MGTCPLTNLFAPLYFWKSIFCFCFFLQCLALLGVWLWFERSFFFPFFFSSGMRDKLSRKFVWSSGHGGSLGGSSKWQHFASSFLWILIRFFWDIVWGCLIELCLWHVAWRQMSCSTFLRHKHLPYLVRIVHPVPEYNITLTGSSPPL